MARSRSYLRTTAICAKPPFVMTRQTSLHHHHRSNQTPNRHGWRCLAERKLRLRVRQYGERYLWFEIHLAPPCSPGNLRRREASTPLDAIAGVNGAYVPGVLTAAGVTGAFGAIYAAHALYAFIDARAAFPALEIVALAAMAAAMLHGPALAGLGLVGALATPLLVSSARHRQHPFRIRGDRAARWGPAA